MIQNSKIIAVGVAANTLFEKNITSNTQQYVKIIIEFEKNIPSNTQGCEKKHDINRRIYTRYISRNTIVYRIPYLTVCNCFFFAAFNARGKKEIQTSRIHVVLIWEYMGFYSKLVQSCIYLYSVQIPGNTGPKIPIFTIVLRSDSQEKSNLQKSSSTKEKYEHGHLGICYIKSIIK